LLTFFSKEIDQVSTEEGPTLQFVPRKIVQFLNPKKEQSFFGITLLCHQNSIPKVKRNQIENKMIL